MIQFGGLHQFLPFFSLSAGSKSWLILIPWNFSTGCLRLRRFLLLKLLERHQKWPELTLVPSTQSIHLSHIVICKLHVKYAIQQVFHKSDVTFLSLLHVLSLFFSGILKMTVLFFLASSSFFLQLFFWSLQLFLDLFPMHI